MNESRRLRRLERKIKKGTTIVSGGGGGGGTGATDFLGLSDTPNAYTGEALKVVRVNAGETALEFAPGGGSGTVNSGTQYRIAYYATTGTAVSEASAITASRALVSDSNGVPTHSATTSAEVGYLSGLQADAVDFIELSYLRSIYYLAGL